MSNWIGEPKRMVVCAAMKFPNGFILCSPRHYDSTVHAFLKLNSGVKHGSKASDNMPIQGFVDQHGVFMDSQEALVVATLANQINVHRTKTSPVNELFSEDLY